MGIPSRRARPLIQSFINILKVLFVIHFSVMEVKQTAGDKNTNYNKIWKCVTIDVLILSPVPPI